VHAYLLLGPNAQAGSEKPCGPPKAGYRASFLAVPRELNDSHFHADLLDRLPCSAAVLSLFRRN
jgi:hypothetical protein